MTFDPMGTEPKTSSYEWTIDHRRLIDKNSERAELVILPREISDGIGSYLMDDVSAYKVLRANGIDIRYLQDSSHRTIVSEYSANEIIALSIFAGEAIGEQSIQGVVGYLFARVTGAQRAGRKGIVDAKIAQVKISKDGTTKIKGIRVKGDGEQVVSTIRQILQEARGENGGHEKDAY